MPLVKESGAAVIALTIDETGMAKTAQRKLEVARRIATSSSTSTARRRRADLRRSDLHARHRRRGVHRLRRETIEGIRLIKRELPGVLTSLGVSNVSFGLAGGAARAELGHAASLRRGRARHGDRQSRRDHAVCRDQPEERTLCDDLVSTGVPMRCSASSSTSNPRASRKSSGKRRPTTMRRTGRDADPQRHPAASQGRDRSQDRRGAREARSGRRAQQRAAAGDERSRRQVRRGRADPAVRAAVGRGDEEGRRATSSNSSSGSRASAKGTIVLATVFGDVHDIGKNLVGTILSNNGYTVHDLGKQVPVGTILDKAVEVKADAIGLSALLVSTSKQMPALVKEQVSRGLTYPVVIGGAAINRDFGRRTAFAPERLLRPRRLLRQGRLRGARSARYARRRRGAHVARRARPARSRSAPCEG
jgi:5-methyltetrahydrofolate--homocysteine methyltransferase